MSFEIPNVTVTRNADGSADLVSTGGLDPHFTADEVKGLAHYLTHGDAEPTALEVATAKVTNLESLSRADLDALAASKGVDNPQALANKGEVIEAIEAAG